MYFCIIDSDVVINTDHIANGLNEYCIGIGQTSASQIQPNNHYDQYPADSRFHLRVVNKQ